MSIAQRAHYSRSTSEHAYSRSHTFIYSHRHPRIQPKMQLKTKFVTHSSSGKKCFAAFCGSQSILNSNYPKRSWFRHPPPSASAGHTTSTGSAITGLQWGSTSAYQYPSHGRITSKRQGPVGKPGLPFSLCSPTHTCMRTEPPSPNCAVVLLTPFASPAHSFDINITSTLHHLHNHE